MKYFIYLLAALQIILAPGFSQDPIPVDHVAKKIGAVDIGAWAEKITSDSENSNAHLTNLVAQLSKEWDAKPPIIELRPRYTNRWQTVLGNIHLSMVQNRRSDSVETVLNITITGGFSNPLVGGQKPVKLAHQLDRETWERELRKEFGEEDLLQGRSYCGNYYRSKNGLRRFLLRWHKDGTLNNIEFRTN